MRLPNENIPRTPNNDAAQELIDAVAHSLDMNRIIEELETARHMKRFFQMDVSEPKRRKPDVAA